MTFIFEHVLITMNDISYSPAKYSTLHKLYMIQFADPAGTPPNFSLCVLETSSFRWFIVYAVLNIDLTIFLKQVFRHIFSLMGHINF